MPTPRSLRLLPSAVLLLACAQVPTPHAGDGTAPWTYAAPLTLSAQRLTPGDNHLTFEAILAATNGWGPIEVNHSNGERAPRDGHALTLNGRTYPSGFGTHAGSDLQFSLGGTNAATCTRFTADVGVDDEVGALGSVVFQVYLDGVKAFDSGVMTGASDTRHLNIDVGGTRNLRLIVTDARNGGSHDHADWANPIITCAAKDSPLNYTFSFAPDTVRAVRGADVTATLVMRDDGYGNDPRPHDGPVSFRLEVFNRSDPGIRLLEPDRQYTATTFPASFPVRVHLETAYPEFGGGRVDVVLLLEGYDRYALFGTRPSLFWSIPAP